MNGPDTLNEAIGVPSHHAHSWRAACALPLAAALGAVARLIGLHGPVAAALAPPLSVAARAIAAGRCGRAGAWLAVADHDPGAVRQLVEAGGDDALAGLQPVGDDGLRL